MGIKSAFAMQVVVSPFAFSSCEKLQSQLRLGGFPVLDVQELDVKDKARIAGNQRPSSKSSVCAAWRKFSICTARSR